MTARWKRHELAVARQLGTERNPSNGRRQADIDADIPFAIEHKTRKLIPAWLTNAMAQAVAGVVGKRTPVVVLDYCRGRGHTTERYAIMRWSDFLDWHGRVDLHADCGGEFHRCHDGGGPGEADRHRGPAA